MCCVSIFIFCINGLIYHFNGYTSHEINYIYRNHTYKPLRGLIGMVFFIFIKSKDFIFGVNVRFIAHILGFGSYLVHNSTHQGGILGFVTNN